MSQQTKSRSQSVFQHLLKMVLFRMANIISSASGKDVLLKLCNMAILYKGLTVDVLPESSVAEWSSTLGITKGETKQVIVSLSALLQQAVFLCASDPATVSAAFPGDFHKDLKKLISSIVMENLPKWKTTLASSNSMMPQLVDVQCRVDNSLEDQPLDVLPTLQTNCTLQLKLQENVGGDNGETRTVKVQLSREKLNTMLDGLSKIRDQLTSVTQR